MTNCKTCSHVDVCGYAFDDDERNATVYCSDYQERDRCDREALLELADDLDGIDLSMEFLNNIHKSLYISAFKDAAKRIREACGKDDK